MVSHVKLQQLMRKQELLNERRRKQEAKLRESIKATSSELRDINKQIEEEKYAVLIRLLRETGLPLDNTPLIIGIALEAKDMMDSTDESVRTAAINKYTDRYLAFQTARARAVQAAPAPPTEESAEEPHLDNAPADSPTRYYAEGMG